MKDGINVEVVGEREVTVRLADNMRAMLAEIRNAMRRIGFANEAYIKTRKLSGQVLNRRSGRLSAGVHSDIVEAGDSISTVTGVGEDLIYGKWHEEGGTFTVKEHMRTVRQAFGRPITPVTVKVKTHTITLPVRSWLRSSLREQRDNNVNTLRQAIQNATRQ